MKNQYRLTLVGWRRNANRFGEPLDRRHHKARWMDEGK